jgi:hypothetical protein
VNGTSTTFVAVQFGFKPCVTGTTNNVVNFTSATNGGASYSYLWTFSNGGTTLAKLTHSTSTKTTSNIKELPDSKGVFDTAAPDS